MRGRSGSLPLRFALGGTVQAWHAGEHVDLGPPQRRAVMAVLLLAAGRVVGTDEIIAGVWGEEPAPRAGNAIQAHVSVLRRVLEPGRRPREDSRVVRSVGRGYALDPTGFEVDLFVFRARRASARAARAAGRFVEASTLLGAALQAWTGDALVGVPGPAADLERQALQMERLGAFEELLELRAEPDVASGAAGLPVDLITVLHAHPHRERLHGLAMRALHALGRRADALTVYTGLRRSLVDDLGIEPGTDVRALHKAILAEDQVRTGELPVITSLPVRERAGPDAPPGPDPIRPDGHDVPAVGTRVVIGLPDGDRPYSAARFAPPVTSPLLPAAAPHGSALVGRAALRARLDALLVPEPGPPILLHGIVGVGKTALAVEAVAAVVDRFPGGMQIVGVGAPAPARPGSLLVLDGIHAEAELDERLQVPPGAGAGVLQRLAGSGTTVLITGTHQLRRLVPARRVEVGPLTLDESYELFARHLGRERVDAEPQVARALLEWIGGLPVVVAAAAEQLAVRSSWSLAEYTADGAAMEREDPRHFTEVMLGPYLQRAIAPLDPATLALLITCSRLPDPDFSRDDVLAARPGPGVHLGLGTLVDHHLLAEPCPGRFRMHVLIRAYVRMLRRPAGAVAYPA